MWGDLTGGTKAQFSNEEEYRSRVPPVCISLFSAQLRAKPKTKPEKKQDARENPVEGPTDDSYAGISRQGLK